MTKLFLITLRWMKKDRKRTLLSFLSILLAVYMMTMLGIYFSSTVSFLGSKERYEKGSYHLKIHCDDAKQAEKIAGNAAVSESSSIFNADYGFIEDYLKKYKSNAGRGSVNYLPTFSLNGKTFPLSRGTPAFAAKDADELTNSIPLKKGRFPQKAGEIVIHSRYASDQNLDIGDTVVLSYEVRKGTLTYSEYTNKLVGSANALKEQRVYSVKDKPDDTGMIVNNFVTQIDQVYSQKNLTAYEKQRKAADDLYYLFTLSDTSTDRTPWNWGYTAQDNNAYRLTNNDTIFTYAQTKTEPEPVEVMQYRAKIVGVTEYGINSQRATELIFSYEDEAAKKMFPMHDGYSYVRIKEGYDVDDEAEQIRKTVGIAKSFKDESGIHDTVSLNDMLLFYEGRSLYNPSSADPMIILGALTVVLVVFVFFARLIINNAFELSSAYRLSQYSSLKTVGVSSGQMFVMIMGECLLYLIAALPIALLLAFATGKVIISKITDLKIFDALYGSGVTDRFFKLEISTGIMVLVISITVFSVLMSAYAVAIRMIKMPAVQTRAADGVKPPKPVRRSWYTRRLFGFSAGLAVRSAFRKRMRFFIMLLATIVSTTLVITISSLIFALYKSDSRIYDPDMPDYVCYINTDFSQEQNFSDDYKLIKTSGLFSKIGMGGYKTLCFTDPDSGIFTDGFAKQLSEKNMSAKIRISAITPMDYAEYIRSDISYDKLVANGGVLVCSEIYKSDEQMQQWEDTGSKAVKDDQQKIILNVTKDKPEKHSIEICGTYTPRIKRIYDEINRIYTHDDGICVIVPVENYYKLLSWIKPNDDGLVTDYGGVIAESNDLTDDMFSLICESGKEEQAKEFLNEKFENRILIEDNVPQKHTNERISKALRIAGLSLSAIIFAVALINIISTCAAEMVNRRRELSMLRACGMSLRQIFKTLRLEVLFFWGVSTVTSAVLGTMIASLIFRFLSDGTNDPGKMASLPFAVMIAVFATLLVLLMGAYLLPIRSMAKTPIAQDVRMKE